MYADCNQQPSNAGTTLSCRVASAEHLCGGMVKARVQMKGTTSQKTVGSSWIQLDEVFHELTTKLTVGDRKHGSTRYPRWSIDR